MASPRARAPVLPAILVAFLAAGAALPRTARAIEERFWFSAELDANFYDSEQAMKDNGGFGLRAAGFLNRHFGIEGLFSTSSPTLEPPATGSGSLKYYGLDVIATSDRFAWTLPYIYLGGGHVSATDGGGSEGSGAIYGGAGLVLRAGERLGFRLDGRDLSYNQTGGPGRDTRVNVFVISGAVTAFWGGRPRDTDEDGVPDKKDVSPNTPAGAVVDATGTPIDTDKDGVFDGLDKCPNTPVGAKVDASGCPIDSDKDGVPDGIDKCDSTAVGVVVDATGCGIDTDKDGVFDGLDKCANTPAGAKVDSIGCPIDSDGDGIPDGIDICPYTPRGALVNAGGCPLDRTPFERAMLTDWMIRLTDLEFPPDSAVLLPQAKARLDSVGVVLEQWPMVKMEIGVHVDDQPEPGYRIPLTAIRARAIQQYLLQTFPMLNPKNYWLTGYGDSQPLAPNTSSAGRAQNRRVEFRVVNMNVMVAAEEKRDSFGSTPAPPVPGLTPKAPPPQQAPPEDQTPPQGEQTPPPAPPEGQTPPQGQAPPGDQTPPAK
jgi:OOP family OmpA-OmpF porin